MIQFTESECEHILSLITKDTYNLAELARIIGFNVRTIRLHRNKGYINFKGATGTPLAIPADEVKRYIKQLRKRSEDADADNGVELSSKYTRTCTTCGKPTNNWRCDECWAKHGRSMHAYHND